MKNPLHNWRGKNAVHLIFIMISIYRNIAMFTSVMLLSSLIAVLSSVVADLRMLIYIIIVLFIAVGIKISFATHFKREELGSSGDIILLYLAAGTVAFFLGIFLYWFR